MRKDFTGKLIWASIFTSYSWKGEVAYQIRNEFVSIGKPLFPNKCRLVAHIRNSGSLIITTEATQVTLKL